MDEFDTSNLVVMEILLYAVLLPLLGNHDLIDLVTEQANDEIMFRQNVERRLRSQAQIIFHELGKCLGYSPSLLLERLL